MEINKEIIQKMRIGRVFKDNENIINSLDFFS